MSQPVIRALCQITLLTGIAVLQPCVWAEEAPAQDLTISIHGNQEQPTVMYIVPWQDASDNKILQNPDKPPLQHIFQQVERREHEREIRYLLNQTAENP
jgi:hypothetical protein